MQRQTILNIEYNLLLLLKIIHSLLEHKLQLNEQFVVLHLVVRFRELPKFKLLLLFNFLALNFVVLVEIENTLSRLYLLLKAALKPFQEHSELGLGFFLSDLLHTTHDHKTQVARTFNGLW